MKNPIKHFDLESQQFADGTIRLTQMDYAGEAAVIDLSLAQLKHLAEEFAGVPDRMTGSIHSRLLELQSDLRYFTDWNLWIDEIAESISDGLAFQIGADAMRHDLDRIITDLGLIPLNSKPEQDPVDPPKQSKFHPEQPPKQYQQGDLLGGAS